MSHRSITATLAVAVLLLAGIWQPSPSAAAPGLSISRAAVYPKVAVPGSISSQRIFIRYWIRERSRLSIRIIRADGGRTVRRFVTREVMPGGKRWFRQNWDGLDGKGRLSPPGRYRVLAGPVGGPLRKLVGLRLKGHLFPVAGPHGLRGPVGEFGAPRVDGRIHEGFDITAACGTPLVAVRSGTILKSSYDPELKGNYVVMKGRSERRTYLYAHLERRAPVRQGQSVRAGRRLGTVGQTGNAAGTPCHLHFEVRSRGRLLDPELLLNWWG